jgi:hypothetical protein
MRHRGMDRWISSTGIRVSFAYTSGSEATYAELPLGLPQGFNRALVWVDGVEFLSHHPWRHDECSCSILREVKLGLYRCSSMNDD